MIFPHDQAGYLNRGQRTTIRVPVDPRLTLPLRPARRKHSRPFVPTIGELLGVGQPIKREDANGGPAKDGWETVCHVRITSIHRGPLGQLTDDQAIAEGYPTTGEFVQAWVERHDRDFLDRQVRYLTEQGVDEQEAQDTREEWAKVRYRDRWATREVWTLTVGVEHDLDRHLEPAATAKSEHGYTIGPDTIDAGVIPPIEHIGPRWARKAARRHLEAIAENASPEERSRRARALARRVRTLAIQDPALTRKIEQLVREAEQEAA